MAHVTKLIVCVVCSVVFGWLAPGARAADKVANPAYKMWAQYKVGTWVSHQTTTQMPKAEGDDEAKAAMQNMSMKMTRKLVELTADKAVVETVMTVNRGGQEMAMPGNKQEIPALVDADKADDTAFLQGAAGEKGEIKKGEEEIKVLDKTLKCKWVQTTTKRGEGKVWLSDQIPGGLVRMEHKMPQMTSTMELTGFEVAK